ncbi:hypothetical protein GCM10027176_03140 [Actinoallomurus bryophytorum]|uniref:nicotinamide mononucleotide transporter n=1 Tax=Actinoallomurus bryophytorum TaxID=1490222 RepID=UPI001C8AD640|nr:nicotinamide mononucleotide transporter [Actinoallomurus bryophytorum]
MILFGLIFVDGGLYADAGLQAVYVVLQAWGWWQWLYGGRGRTELVIQRTSRTEWFGLAVAPTSTST